MSPETTRSSDPTAAGDEREASELDWLRKENQRLKALISDLMLDRSILEEVLRNS